MSVKSHLPRTIAALALCVALTSASASELRLTKEIVNDIAKTYGFVESQSYTLRKIVELYPQLASPARIAEGEFKVAFGSSVTEMEKRMDSALGNKWTEIRRQLQAKIPTVAEATNISKKQAEEFIGMVRSRAKGEMPSPVLETLLIYSPNYSAQPVNEFFDGYRKTYRTSNNPKALGLELAFEYPASWLARDGKRPHTLVQVTSELGRGFDMCNLVITKLPTPDNYTPSKSELKDFFSQKNLHELVPEGGKFQEGKSTTIEGQPGARIFYDTSMERAGEEAKMKSVLYSFIYRTQMVILTCMVWSADDSPDSKLEAQFQNTKELFQQIGNSIVLNNAYKNAP